MKLTCVHKAAVAVVNAVAHSYCIAAVLCYTTNAKMLASVGKHTVRLLSSAYTASALQGSAAERPTVTYYSFFERFMNVSLLVTGAVWDLLTDKRVRLLVISFSILHAAQQLSGINAVFYYSTSFFKGIVANPLVGTAAAGTVNVIATYAALKLMDSACSHAEQLLYT
eukprot:14715-Heterococcus_DN1.PRE.4